jgi:hypothetical protein
MKKLSAILLAGLVGLAVQAPASDAAPLRLVQTIPLANVEGRIDHLAIDIKRRRLFVAALGNSTVEVVDLKAGRQARTITGFREPQGILFIPELNRLVVADGGDGICRILDGNSLDVIRSIRLSSDADNLRYDPALRYLYVGYGEGGLGIIDAVTGAYLGDIQLAGHPESFQLEKSGPRIFVNIPSAAQIAVIDKEKRAVVAAWPLKDARANFPMALDEMHHRLFVGFRKPPRLMMFDAESGKTVATLGTVRDCDDIFYDPAHRRIYLSCGEGFLDVFERKEPDHYLKIAKIPTLPGARTALFVPELKLLYLAVPRRAHQEAEIRVYQIQP